MRLVPALGVALVLLVAGCLGGPSSDSRDAGADPSASPHVPTPTSSRFDPPTPSPSKPPAPTNGTPPPPSPGPQKPWPAIDQATIRPGIQITWSSGSSTFFCTSNFLFRSPDNATLYLGLAAHCVDRMKLGGPMDLRGTDGQKRKGKLAYSSWIAKNLDCNASVAGTGCTSGPFTDDFALVEIDASERSRVHPALLHFGGPTSLADSAQFPLGARVLGYGNSPTWPAEPARWHEGVVTETQGSGNQFSILTAAPGIQGDSGSAVMTRDGRAAGVLVTGCLAPCTGQNGIVGLKYALDLEAKLGGPRVELVTWAQLDDGLLP